MNSKLAVVLLSVAAAICAGCSSDGGGSQTGGNAEPAPVATRPTASQPTASQPVTSQPSGRKIITVANADELVAAIGPDRTIKIAPGIYDISSVAQRKMEFVVWKKVYDGYELIVRKVSGLTLIASKEPPQLLAKPRYAHVLTFDGCKQIVLQNLVLGHTPEGYCTGGVVRMNKCGDVKIDRCDLFGCGTDGLALSEVTGLQFSHSTIRDCTYGIMTASGSSDIVLSDSSFVRNREFYGFSFSDSRNIRLERCSIKDNQLGSLDAILFSATSCSDITVSGGEIIGNMYKKIMAPAGAVKITETKIENNSEPVADE